MSHISPSGDPNADEMNRTAPPSAPDAVLDALVEEFTDRMQAGEQPDIDSFVAKHPERAEQLKALLPWARAMASVDFPPASGEAQTEDLELTGRWSELGDFRLIREIGRGGMGVVYEAEQKSLGRRVALKVLPYASMFDARQLQRFKNEARAVAALDHPHIVAIHTVGCDQNVHFYAMQLIEGKSLAEVIASWRRAPDHEAIGPRAELRNEIPNGTTTGAEVPSAELEALRMSLQAANSLPSTAHLPTDVSNLNVTFEVRKPALPVGSVALVVPVALVARWGLEVARALEHAHQMGIVHRDVKPSNLLVNAQGHLSVADFGLAMIGYESGLTQTGDIPGTLRYMSPEQLRGNRKQLDHRTDIYSLGVTLYELLTLEPAFPGSDRAELTKCIVETGMKSPRSLNRAIPSDLESIILKAAARDIAQRYESAGELAEDLSKFLNGESIPAQAKSGLRRFVDRISRRPKYDLVIFGSLILVAAGLLLTRPWHENDQSTRQPVSLAGKIIDKPPASSAASILGGPADNGLSDEGQASDGKIDGLGLQLRDGWRSGANSFEAGYNEAALETLTATVKAYRQRAAVGPLLTQQKLYGALAEATLGRVLWKCGQLEAAVPFLNAGLAGISERDDWRHLNDRDRQNAANVCFQIAVLYGELLLWDEAATCFRQGISIAPDSLPVHRQWMYRACMTAAAGDDKTYRPLTREIYERYHADNDADVRCFFTQALCLASNPDLDPQLVAQIADQPWLAPRSLDVSNSVVWKIHAAQAHLEAGHLGRAEELATDMLGFSLIYPIYSVVEANRGRDDLAKYWLERLESDRRQDARKILFSPVNEPRGVDWLWLANHQTGSARAQRALAYEKILTNPWVLLVQGRNRTLMRKNDRAERDFNEAIESAPYDSRLLIERGRVFMELRHDDRAAADFARAQRTQPVGLAIHSESDSPHPNQSPDAIQPGESTSASVEPLIGEAHAWLERGEVAAAELLFRQTLSRPNDELDLFLQTDGWWVAGPCPSELETTCSPEMSQNLGQPIDASAFADAPNNAKLTWQRRPSMGYGTVRLDDCLPQEGGCSAYLLTYVYSAAARTIDFHVGSDGPRRVWLNSQPVHTSQVARIWEFDVDRVPLELREGRNTLLVKVCGTSNEKAPQTLFARLGDSPIDRAQSLAEAYLFSEASDMFELAIRRASVQDPSMPRMSAHAAAAAGHDQRCLRAREVIWENDRRLPNDSPYWSARAWLLRPGVPDDSQHWLTVLQRGFTPPIDEGRNVRIHAALARYRLGQHLEALNEIEDLVSDKYPHSWPILAMIRHALGQSDQAAEALERGALWRRSFLNHFLDAPVSEKSRWWGGIAEFESLNKEACRLIQKRSAADDGWWWLAIARGKLRLGQKEAADAAFQMAGEMARIDPGIWSARGAAYAEQGDFDRASADFQLSREKATSAQHWHDLARHLANAANIAESASRKSQSELFQKQAVEAVRSATAAGMTIDNQLRNSPALKSLLNVPGFEAPEH